MRTLLLLLVLPLAAQAQNVLSGRAPSRAEGVPVPGRLTDLQSPDDGDPWDGPSAVLLAPSASVVWDLGAPTRLTAAAIQADNNDDYFLAISDDDVNWRDLLRFGGIEGSGLRTRTQKGFDVTARYVRLRAAGGDGRYSISELELLGPDTDDSRLMRSKWIPRRPLEQTFIAWVLGAWLVLAFASRRLPGLVQLLLGGGALAFTWWLVFSLTPSSPQAIASLPWLRASVALVAMGAVVRERLGRGRWPAPEGFIVGTLGVTAAMAMWCFLNLGTPQFFDATAGRGTWLHHYDMRTYYPIAKYFPELRFDGVYAASVLALADGRDLSQFDGLGIRDLRTHVMTNVRESKAHLLEVRSRFTPERWALFVADMNYFRRAMGDGGFIGSMNDHGGNATPVWFLSARALFVSAPASDATLWTGVIADLVLLALAFLALGWAWGPRTALLAITVFGAMDFYQFGSNWFGATLRHDWLSLWAIGLALLKKRKLELAGAAFAWSAWIRAFPALTFVTLSLPVIWVSARLVLQHRAREVWAVAKPLLRVALGVAIASVVLVGLSVAIFGADSWTEWLHKVQVLDRDNHLNNIAFRTYVSLDKRDWYVACVVSVLALGFLLRNASPARAAAWGVALVPMVFNPANYYLHSMFLLVTLAAEHPVTLGPRTSWRGALVWLTLLAMCVGSYFTNLSTDGGLHFRMETWVCFGTLGSLLALELFRPSEKEVVSAA